MQRVAKPEAVLPKDSFQLRPSSAKTDYVDNVVADAVVKSVGFGACAPLDAVVIRVELELGDALVIRLELELEARAT